MNSPKAWLAAFLIFTAIGASKEDVCLNALKSMESKIMQKLAKLEADVKNICGPNSPGSYCSPCRDIYLKQKSRGNRAYMIQTNSGKIPVYCHMTSNGLGACGGGGWTLAMKIDGHKSTFHYNSKFWSNKNDFNRPGGATGFDAQETKLPTYWSTPFSKICLAMKIGHQIKSIVINRQANSLYSLIADGHYRSTSLGRNTWKSLIGSQASLPDSYPVAIKETVYERVACG